MAQLPAITNVPAAIAADMQTLMQQDVGSTETGKPLYVAWLQHYWRPRIAGLRRRRDTAAAVAAEVDARVVVEAALETERVARLAAERASDDATVAEIEGVS